MSEVLGQIPNAADPCDGCTCYGCPAGVDIESGKSLCLRRSRDSRAYTGRRDVQEAIQLRSVKKGKKIGQRAFKSLS